MVLSVPKRALWHLREKREVIAGLLRIFLRAMETTTRQRSPGAPSGARFGAVAFVQRFGSDLNSHVQFSVSLTDGVFTSDDTGEAEFHPATDLDTCHVVAVQAKVRRPGLRWLHRHERPAGRQQVRWDGRDDSGRAAAAGVYLLRLETEAGLRTARAVLVK